MERRIEIETPLGKAEGIYRFTKGVPPYAGDVKRFEGRIEEKGVDILVIDGDDKMIVVKGNTYPIKEQLKKLRFWWDSGARAWVYGGCGEEKMIGGFSLPDPEELEEG